MSIRRKILAIGALVALVFSGYVMFIWAPEDERGLVREVETHLHEKLSITSEAIMPLLAENRDVALRKALSSILRSNRDWISLELRNIDGQPLYASIAASRGKAAMPHMIKHDASAEGQVLGRLFLTVDLLPSLEREREQHLELAIAFSAMFLLALAAIFYFIDIFVSAPMLKLATAADKVALGDYESPLPETGNDELGKLTRSFDEMRQALVKKSGTILQFGQIMDQSVNEIYLFDTRSLLFLEVNRGAQQNLGYSIDELRAMTPLDLKVDLIKEEFLNLLSPLASGVVESVSISTRHRRKNGTYYPVEVHLQLSKVTEPPVYVAVAQDISERQNVQLQLEKANENLEAEIHERTRQLRQEVEERKRAMESLRQAREEAYAANLTKTEFLAHMSHELRSPLNAIIGFSEAIQYEIFGKIGPSQYGEYVNNIHSSGQHLLELINDILDISAVELGKLELYEAEIDIGETFDAVLTMLRPRIENKKLKVIARVSKALPKLRADERRLKQILINILTNAIKFTENGGRIETMAALRDDGAMVLTIRDSGIGMDTEELLVAMSEFGQVRNSSSESHEGTGLGLPLCAALAKEHGGGLEIDSARGQGTTITAWFPANRVIFQ